ncbi:MAG: helix-turn-helix transcriptional regulator [Aeriscardovia sp.]|nr:helix-turn-helix transcriptional regulator [Aeriscardovia sp.]
MGKLQENIKNLRILNGLSQRDLAEKIDRSTNTISNWEMEKATPDADVLEKLCQVFGVTPNQLYGWESCKELEDFVNEKRELMLQLENLQREKLEIDAKIKAYSEQLYRRT